MEYDQPLDKDFQEDLHLSSEARANLNETAGWAKFLSIIGFIFVGFMVLISFSMGTIFSMMPMGEELPFPPVLFSIVYLGLALLYFFPVLYLYKFSTRMKDAIGASSQGALEEALSNIKSHYKFLGIMTIVLISLYVLGFVGGLFASFASF